MALTESRWQRVLMLCALYAAQGVPWGFMLITLPAYLSAEFNATPADISKLKAIIIVPWTFKLIWAPIMESYTIRSMGRRRPWIMGAELMMALTLLGFLFVKDPSESFGFLVGLFFIHNCFASLQDVCTDALAVDVLPPEEQGRTNGLMWGAKLVGKGIGAWALALILKRYGLETCVYAQIGILLAIMTVPLLILERPGERRMPWSPGTAQGIAASNTRPPLEILRDVLRAYSLPTLMVYVVFTLTKLVGIGIVEVVTDPLYTQELTPKWTHEEVSTVKGLYAVSPVIICSILGGYLGDLYGRRYVLVAGFGGYAIAVAVYAACPHLWNESLFSATFLILVETMFAIGSVGFLSMAMRISWTTAAATVFTVYMTLSNVSHFIGNAAAGWLQPALIFEEYGDAAVLKSYELTFWCVAVLSALPLLLLPWVLTKEVDEAKEAESSQAEEVPA